MWPNPQFPAVFVHCVSMPFVWFLQRGKFLTPNVGVFLSYFRLKSDVLRFSNLVLLSRTLKSLKSNPAELWTFEVIVSQSFLNSFEFLFFRKSALLPDDGCFFKDWWIVSPSAMVLFIYKDMLLLLTLSCIMLK